ncbi:MAG: hypothetical protein EBQ79_04770 [Actinobacteria bacterium]|nr:hypothetical protein [Actinomycetota bacterium]NDC19964.1 hypothetical protein [Microbacteriaceae bacterium]
MCPESSREKVRSGLNPFGYIKQRGDGVALEPTTRIIEPLMPSTSLELATQTLRAVELVIAPTVVLLLDSGTGQAGAANQAPLNRSAVVSSGIHRD